MGASVQGASPGLVTRGHRSCSYEECGYGRHLEYYSHHNKLESDWYSFSHVLGQILWYGRIPQQASSSYSQSVAQSLVYRVSNGKILAE